MPEAIVSTTRTRVSNALGAGSPEKARVAVVATMTLAGSQDLLDVLNYVTDMTPLICVSIILDTLH
ncbi:hypothetical protein HN51_056186, partial [Arachis hypogaea]